MTSHQKYLSLCLLMIVALLYGPSPALAQLDNFAVLAGDAVTCTNSTVTGDVGVADPTGAVTQTSCTVMGTVYPPGHPAAQQAYQDFLAAYAALATQPACTAFEVPLSNATLPPGVYCYAAAVTATGTLTLDGPCNGTWIFRIGTSGAGALTTTDFTVQHANPACNACDSNVFWWTAQAATLTRTTLIGSILAGADITVTGPGGALDGQALAGGLGTTAAPTGAVTLTGALVTACEATGGGPGGGPGGGNDKPACNQGVGNGPEDCDPGNSNNRNPSNDEDGGIPGAPGRQGGNR
jgi:ice-binding like protein